jgi:hypothetical protein
MIALAFANLALIATSVLAAPAIDNYKSCSLEQAKLTVPANQTQLVVPNETPSFVSFAIGVQNYTCASSGTYSSAGAVAELFDASCLVGTPCFEDVQDIAFQLWKSFPEPATAQDVFTAGHNISRQLSHQGIPNFILGQHYFIANPSGTGSAVPKWDFTSSGPTAGNQDAYVIGSKTGGIPSPDGHQNVDWLALAGVQGKLAKQIFRTDTVAGQPPASCTPGSPVISVKYASKYWFYGSSL